MLLGALHCMELHRVVLSPVRCPPDVDLAHVTQLFHDNHALPIKTPLSLSLLALYERLI